MLAAPALVPLSMSGVFALLARRTTPRAAYNVGFGLYWLGWCTAFPLSVLGPRRAWRVLVSGRPPSPAEGILLLVPPAGAVLTQLWPNRRDLDALTATVMVSTGVLNAVGEELLWRGVFVETFPGEVVRGALWPLAGFALWHLGPADHPPVRPGPMAVRVGRGPGRVGVHPQRLARRGGCAAVCCHTPRPTPAESGQPASGSATKTRWKERRHAAPARDPVTWRVFGVLMAAALAGVVAILPYVDTLLARLPEDVQAALPSRWLLLPLQVVQALVLIGLATALGLWLGPEGGSRCARAVRPRPR